MRLQKIFTSPCFDRAKADIPDFEGYVNEKIVAVNGDLKTPQMGIDNAVYQEMTSRLQVIINVAATVDFTERLDNALRINTLGPMYLLQMAKASPHLEICTHVSTAYVNCDKSGRLVDEKIYDDLGIDPDDLIKRVMNMTVEDIEKQQTKIIGKFPNTYTFTKSMGE